MTWLTSRRDPSGGPGFSAVENRAIRPVRPSGGRTPRLTVPLPPHRCRNAGPTPDSACYRRSLHPGSRASSAAVHRNRGSADQMLDVADADGKLGEMQHGRTTRDRFGRRGSCQGRGSGGTGRFASSCCAGAVRPSASGSITTGRRRNVLLRRVVDIAQTTCSIPRHPRESGDPGIMGSRFRGNDEEARKATAKSMT